METRLLREQEVYPSEKVLGNAMGGSFPAYEELIKTLTDAKYGLIPVWNYYRDGNTWLCKVCHKKKTIFWLSVWDKYFKITFYFTEKNRAGVAGLDIEEQIKEYFNSQPGARLIPLTLTLTGKEQLKDVIRLVEYKKDLK